MATTLQTFFDTYSREVKFSVNLFSMQKYAQKYFVYAWVYQQHAQGTHPLTRTHTHCRNVFKTNYVKYLKRQQLYFNSD